MSVAVHFLLLRQPQIMYRQRLISVNHFLVSLMIALIADLQNTQKLQVKRCDSFPEIGTTIH